MKKLASTLAVISSLIWAAPSHALFISDVGGLDNFIASTTLPNSGDATELAWVQGLMGAGITMGDKYNSSGGDWTLADDIGNTDVYYAVMNTAPNFFLLKLGTGGTTLQSHYLFENVGDMNHAVVDFSDAGVDFTIQNISIDRMSHVGEFSGRRIQVPEPTGLALLGLSLLGLSGLSRRR